MNEPIEHSGNNSGDSKQGRSLGHGLVFWFLIGWSFWSLGAFFLSAIDVGNHFSSIEIGPIIATPIIALLWLVGIQPSLSDCLKYFVTEFIAEVFLFVVYVPIFVQGYNPWVGVRINVVSILLAGTLFLTEPGRWVQRQIRQQIDSALKMPPERKPPEQ
jgi:hypothetical protein